MTGCLKITGDRGHVSDMVADPLFILYIATPVIVKGVLHAHDFYG